MLLRNRLAAIFSPTRRLADAGRGIVRTGGVLGGQQWVVPRAECDYRRIDLPALPPRKREAAARIAASRFDPQPGALHHVAWSGKSAHVWTWPSPARELVGADAGWIPESLLRPPPAHDGLRLLRQVRGVEAQAWRDGALQASQWWPEAPGLDEWRRFVRASGSGQDVADAVPEPESLPWGEPWGDGANAFRGSPAALERWGWMAVAGIVLLLLGWQLAALLSWSMARARLDARMATLRAEATPLLAARDRAETARAALQSLVDLRVGHDDYRLMAEVVDPLPEGTRLVEWRREGPNLAAVVETTEDDPRVFVSAYAGHPVLSGVVATPLANGMGLAFVLPEPGGGVAAEVAP